MPYTVTMPDGSPYVVKSLLSSGKSNAKLAKSDKAGKGYLTYGLSLAPSTMSGRNMCPRSTPGCAAGCLFYAGQGRFTSVQRGRIAKTRLFIENRPIFFAMLWSDLQKARVLAQRKGLKLAVRLNVLSDLSWEKLSPELFAEFADVQFYDYTKVPGRVPPSNYHLTFSRSESNERDALNELKSGKNVAVVFRDKNLPSTWHNVPVHNGDETDLRFLDKRGIVGLYAKGRARQDQSGFVVAN